MARVTHPLRVALAILAGTVFSPLFFALAALFVAFLESPVGPSLVADGASQIAPVVLWIWLTGLLFGGPIALAALLIVFGPIWWLLHRARAGAAVFVALAGVSSGLVGLLLLLFTAGAPGPETVKLIAVFLMAGAMTGAIMWPIAYAATARGRSVRNLQQANSTAAEASA